MTNEYDAMQGLSSSKHEAIQDAKRERNREHLLSEQLRKERVNEAFWHRVWVVCNIVFLAIIILYALFHFA